MNTVGPTTNTNRARATASTILILDRYWIPFEMPETADRMKQIVNTVIRMTLKVLPTLPAQPRIRTPSAICKAPRPSEVAEPNKVAKMAKTSTILPAAPTACRLPSSDSKTAEIVRGRPLRNTE